MRQVQSTGLKSPIRRLPPEVPDIPMGAVLATIPNLVLWFDAETSVKWQTTPGGTLVAASGDPVGTWVDSISGRLAQQGTAVARPVWIPNAYNNGRPALRFDGTNSQLAVTGTSAEEVSDITLFIVAAAFSAGGRVLLAKADDVSGWNSPFQRWGFYDNGSFLTTWNGTNTNTTTWTNSDLKVLELCDADGFANGVKVTDGTDAALTYTHANTPIYISGNGVGSERWNGDICEVVVYGRALSTTERSIVRTALGVKYGISVV